MTGCLYKLQEQKGLFKSIVKVKKSTGKPYFFYGKTVLKNSSNHLHSAMLILIIIIK